MKAQLEALAGLSGVMEVFKFMASVKDYIWILVLFGSFGLTAIEYLGNPMGNWFLYILSRGTLYFLTLWQPLQMLPFENVRTLVAFMFTLGWPGEMMLGLMNLLRLGAFFISAGSIISMVYAYYGVTLEK
jgi:hypothetical protein